MEKRKLKELKLVECLVQMQFSYNIEIIVENEKNKLEKSERHN